MDKYYPKKCWKKETKLCHNTAGACTAIDKDMCIAMWCLWATLDIFSDGIFMVYLIVTYIFLFIEKKRTFLWLFH